MNALQSYQVNILFGAEEQWSECTLQGLTVENIENLQCREGVGFFVGNTPSPSLPKSTSHTL